MISPQTSSKLVGGHGTSIDRVLAMAFDDPTMDEDLAGPLTPTRSSWAMSGPTFGEAGGGLDEHCVGQAADAHSSRYSSQERRWWPNSRPARKGRQKQCKKARRGADPQPKQYRSSWAFCATGV